MKPCVYFSSLLPHTFLIVVLSYVLQNFYAVEGVRTGTGIVCSFIIKFDGSFDATTRNDFMSRAFSRAFVSRTSWQNLDGERSKYIIFSDFSVVEFSDQNETLKRVERALETNPKYVVGVFPNRSWRRLPQSYEKNDENIALGSRKLADFVNIEDVASRHLLRTAKQKSIAHLINADKLWRMGFTGSGVKIAVFDTGLPDDHPHFLHIRKKIDWTTDPSVEDQVGHGTFVAGLIGGRNPNCVGIAPEADLHIYRVFTNAQVSYTSWFLDAFNYAITENIDVINLSIGGPDFMDRPFTEKVLELTANGVIFVSAIGNEGPLYGTLNNPGDQLDVLGVGAMNYDEQIARFSARGMTTWELPGGYGRLKPDIVTYGTHVNGPSLNGGCRPLSGTSVASPVVAGAVGLLLSAIKDRLKPNPAIIKQALISGAKRLQTSANMFEQGHGAMNLIGALKALLNYQHHASVSPSYIDMTECPYMWPYCSQPLFFGGLPVAINFTILNGMGVYGVVSTEPVWVPYEKENGRYISVAFEYARELWPYAGWLVVFLTANEDWDGIASGHVELKIRSGSSESTINIPIRTKIARAPPRRKRILWDQFHNLRYPPGYFPRDNLNVKKDPLDWHGDHVHTNFRDLYQHLRSAGYFIDVLGTPFTCVDASQYAAILLVDPEEEFFAEELEKIWEAVDSMGLNLIVFADWFNLSVMKKIRFFDENTKQWWQPQSGGSNVPALNSLLSHWNISLGSSVLDGEFELGRRKLHFASGTNITAFPVDGVIFAKTLNDQGAEIAGNKTSRFRAYILGLLDTAKTGGPSGGKIAVFGDSNCLDSSHLQSDCFWLLDAIFDFTITGFVPSILKEDVSPIFLLPPRNDVRKDFNDATFSQHSKVIESISRDGEIVYKHLPECPRWSWAKPRFANASMSADVRRHLQLLALTDQVDLPPYLDEARLFHWEKSVLADGDRGNFAWSISGHLLTPPTFALALVLFFIYWNRRYVFRQVARVFRYRRRPPPRVE